jgi:cyclophilin family peptidyl-prolyl cis-trans isomerase
MAKNSLTALIVIAVVLILGGALFYLPAGEWRVKKETIVVSPRGEGENKNSQKIKESMGKRSGSSRVSITTNKGVIRFDTFDADAPKTVANFLALAGKGFYKGLTFHRVVKGFVIQGGDPKGDGTGGPGYTFEDELNPETESYKRGYKKGTVAMANAGPDTNGSQFFIMLEDALLPHAYTIFGRVAEGQEVVDAIGRVPTGPGDRPLEPIIMKSVEVEERAQ